jgi:hypothetical protein
VNEPAAISEPLLSHIVTGEGPPVLLLHGLDDDRDQSLSLLAPHERYTRIVPEMPPARRNRPRRRRTRHLRSFRGTGR